MKLLKNIVVYSDSSPTRLIKLFTVVTCLFSLNVTTAGSFIDKGRNINSKNFNWSGPYVGGFVGGVWGKSNFNTDAGVITDTSYFLSTKNIFSVNRNGSPELDFDTFTGGLQIGNNWILNNLLYGFTLDYGSLNNQNSKTTVGIKYPTTPEATYSIGTSLQTNWLFSARGRLGFISGPSWPMIYATGGLALTKLKIANTFNDSPMALGIGAASSSSTKTGWTVGCGIELPVAEHFTINSEYLYVHFNSVSVAGSVICSGDCNVSSQLNTSANLNANLIRVGINYKV